MITGNESMQPVVVPAFVYGDGSYEQPSVQEGLTIRQYFAAMAMASGSTPETSVKKADALIKELNKPV